MNGNVYKVNKHALQDLDIFLKLPDIVQKHVWLDLYNGMDGMELTAFYNFEEYIECESPSEIIFYYYFDKELIENIEKYKKYTFTVYPQYELQVGRKRYFADFLICCHAEDAFDLAESQVIVECDGHEFHEKTKLQVKQRNERDYNLKMEGYEVIHFSGSEIYNESQKCAKKVIEYLIKQLK